MVVSLAIESWIEGGVIAGVVALNIVVGFFQEYQAEKTMDSLRSLSSPTANVVRDGQTINIPTAELVPGDIVELKTGDGIPADIRYDMLAYPYNIPLGRTPQLTSTGFLNPSISKPMRRCSQASHFLFSRTKKLPSPTILAQETVSMSLTALRPSPKVEPGASRSQPE